MVQSRKGRVKDQEKILSFQRELVQLYRGFEEGVEALSKKHGVKINCWYSPSAIPQPKFVVDKVAFDADEIYSKRESASIRPRKRA